MNDSQVSSFESVRVIQVCGLQTLTQKLDLCLNLEMVNFSSRFRLNYMNNIGAQSF